MYAAVCLVAVANSKPRSVFTGGVLFCSGAIIMLVNSSGLARTGFADLSMTTQVWRLSHAALKTKPRRCIRRGFLIGAKLRAISPLQL
ncbi:MAG TPA: hypothetical protein DEF21_00700 [Thalassospira lucentensis]|uniref:Uncharacterized protein n=1 Tax=Thalassospira lucentensis TaxID=168935 RepID=A0A358HMM6_9PROT|nr:hypothetical protein [Thalassospira lucentensis]HCW67750.1 hypothetical protein [Thalassospira lucentensis]